MNNDLRSSVVDAPPSVNGEAPVAPMSTEEPEIHVIPEKFYGAALQAKIVEAVKPTAAGPEEGEHRSWMLPVIVGVVLLVGVAGGFVYFNQELLFSRPTPTSTPTPPPPAPVPPAAPESLTANATAPNIVSLSWTDKATDESSYRVERRDQTAGYGVVQNLAPDEHSYVDASVEPEKTYLYRVVAVSQGGSSLSNEVTVTTPALPPPPPDVPTLPPAGLDSDSDGLTDLEEPLYGAPVRDPDADKDSFNDGNEVFHLYSPSGKAPGKLLESGLVKRFESSAGWSVFVPTSWQTALEENGRVGRVQTGHGESFRISVEDNPSGQPVLDWYLAQNPGTLSSQVKTVQTKSGFEGLEGADLLTTYFPYGNKILLFRYELGGQPFVNFRTTYEMMKNSLNLVAAAPAPASQSMTPPSGPTPDVAMRSRDAKRIADLSAVRIRLNQARDEGGTLVSCSAGAALSSCRVEDVENAVDLASVTDPSAPPTVCGAVPTGPCEYSVWNGEGTGAATIEDFRILFWLETDIGGRTPGAHAATPSDIQ